MDMGWRVGYPRQGSSYCCLVPLGFQYSPGHRTQSIRSCRNHCQDLYCQDDQSEACVKIMWSVLTNKRLLSGSLMPAMSNNCLQFWESFQHWTAFTFRFVHVFADTFLLRWNLSASVPGRLKLYSMLRAFTRKLLPVWESNQPRLFYKHLFFLCVQESKSYGILFILSHSSALAASNSSIHL